jgi:hypothetical protein
VFSNNGETKINRRDLHFFFYCSGKVDEESSQNAVEEVSELTSGSKSGVEPAKVLIEDSLS